MSNTALKQAATGRDSTDAHKHFPAMLEMYKQQIALALPRHMNADRMARVALTCYRVTPLLAKCDPASVFACIIQASQLGLEPGINGEAYLVPFWNTKKSCYECQLIPGYRGLIKLARNTSQIESVSSRIVYSNDQFEVVLGTEERITHTPELIKDHGEPVLVYCIAKFKDGGFHFEPMTWKQVMAIKARSKSKNKSGELVGPWITDQEEMARKTVIRRASKYWPMSVELATAVELDNAAAMGVAQGLDVASVIAGESFVVADEDDDGAGGIEGGIVQDQKTGAETVPPVIEKPTEESLRAKIEVARSLDDLDVLSLQVMDVLKGKPKDRLLGLIGVKRRELEINIT